MSEKKLPKLGTKAHKELKWKESIAVLNDIVCTKLAPSNINGVGVFALRDFKKGDKMHQNIIPNTFDVPTSKFKKLKPEVREILFGFFPFKAVQPEEIFWYPVNSMQAYMNHSDKPNYDAQEDVALKGIKAGEEITEDYRKIEGWDKVYPWLQSV